MKTFYMARHNDTEAHHSSRAWTRQSDVTQFLRCSITGYQRAQGKAPPWTIEVYTPERLDPWNIAGSDWLKGTRTASKSLADAMARIATDAFVKHMGKGTVNVVAEAQELT
jgi:hypothetical protein